MNEWFSHLLSSINSLFQMVGVFDFPFPLISQAQNQLFVESFPLLSFFSFPIFPLICVNSFNQYFTWFSNSGSATTKHFMLSSLTLQFRHSVVSNSLWAGVYVGAATPWAAACQVSLSLTTSWSLLKLMSIESVMPSNHPILCRPLLLPAFNLSQYQGLFQWVSSLHQVAKVLAFQLQHQSFQCIFRTDFL